MFSDWQVTILSTIASPVVTIQLSAGENEQPVVAEQTAVIPKTHTTHMP